MVCDCSLPPRLIQGAAPLNFSSPSRGNPIVVISSRLITVIIVHDVEMINHEVAKRSSEMESHSFDMINDGCRFV